MNFYGEVEERKWRGGSVVERIWWSQKVYMKMYDFTQEWKARVDSYNKIRLISIECLIGFHIIQISSARKIF